MIAAATSEVEQLRAPAAALDCSLGLVLISIRDFDKLSRKQALSRIAYIVKTLDGIRGELGVSP